MSSDFAKGFGSNLARILLERFIIPKIEPAMIPVSEKIDSILHEINNRFMEYIDVSYRKNSYMTTIVLQNTKKKMHDIYIPLTLVDNSSRRSVRFSSGGGGGNTNPILRRSSRLKIDCFPSDLFSLHSNVLITDTAGMGKSTVSKYIFLKCIEESKAIPILVELRRYTTSIDLIDFIYKDLFSYSAKITKDLFSVLLKKGQFLIILDGYDEVHPDSKTRITSEISLMVERFSNNFFMLTSRPEESLAAFPNFSSFHISPLEKDEAMNLLSKYDSGGNTSAKLRDVLNKTNNSQIDEFLGNPLLVSLLYRAFDFKATIPLKKHLFYRQVFDALYENHDLGKGGFMRIKKSNIDIDDFHKVCRFFGFLSVKAGKVEFSKDEVHPIMENSISLSGVENVSSSSFLEDVVSAVPILTKDGPLYRWSHKSLQDYFCASYIHMNTTTMRGRLLQAMAESKRASSYLNIFNIYSEMDEPMLAKHVYVPVLRNLILSNNALSDLFKDIPGYKKNEVSIVLNKSIVFMPINFLRKFVVHILEDNGNSEIRYRSLLDFIRNSLRSGGCDKYLVDDDDSTLMSNIIDAAFKFIENGNIKITRGEKTLATRRMKAIQKRDTSRYVFFVTTSSGAFLLNGRNDTEFSIIELAHKNMRKSVPSPFLVNNLGEGDINAHIRDLKNHHDNIDAKTSNLSAKSDRIVQLKISDGESIKMEIGATELYVASIKLSIRALELNARGMEIINIDAMEKLYTEILTLSKNTAESENLLDNI